MMRPDWVARPAIRVTDPIQLPKRGLDHAASIDTCWPVLALMNSSVQLAEPQCGPRVLHRIVRGALQALLFQELRGEETQGQAPVARELPEVR